MPGTSVDNYENNADRAARIFTKHGEFIRAVICSRAENNTQADDLFQDFFLSLVRKPIPEDVKDIRNYLYRAICNDICDAIRRNERYHALLKKHSQDVDCSVNNPTPEDALYTEEEIAKVLDLIDRRLPRCEAQAIVLRYAKSRDIKEIAEEMGVESRSVSRYICAGLRKIRRLIQLR